ncbi:MAG TPA: energy transducer TonB [Ferruginibacter sp.]|nr:energy transducer TonB [Ferruginibacter sp.]
MEAQKILTADFLDILFEGRNKLYGAYDIRKSYPERIKKSLLIIGIMLSVALIAVINIHPEQIVPYTPPYETTPGKIYSPPILPVPPSPRQSGSVNNNRFLPLVVRDSTRADTIETQAVDEVSFTGITSPGDVVQPFVNETAVTGSILAVPVPVDNSESDVLVERVEVPAQFPGGMKGWVDYLKNNLDAETPVNNGAPAGTYQVGIRFIVSREGIISKVLAETGLGYGMEAEAIKVISRCPKWIPAMQNGRKVNAYHRQVITFVVSE